MVQAMMRKNQRMIFTVIAVIVVITFVFWGVATGPSSRGSRPDPGRLYGQKVDPRAFEDAQRMEYLNFMLATGQDVTRTEYGQRLLEQRTWLRLILLRKVKEMGVVVTDEALMEHIRSQFSVNGQFDAARYRQFLQQQLPSMRMSEADFERLMREQLALQQVEQFVQSTARVTPTEVRYLYDLIHEKVDVSLVIFETNQMTNQVKIADAELAEFFEKNKENFRIPERRRVRFVRFPSSAHTNEVVLIEDEVRAVYERAKPQLVDDKGNPRPFESVQADIRKGLIEEQAYRRASDLATQLSLDLVKPQGDDKKEPDLTKVDFAAAAAKYGVKPQETDFFAVTTEVPGVDGMPGFQQAAFALTTNEPFSDPVGGQDAVYVLQYLDRKESELPTLDAVRDRVVRALTMERATELTQKKGQEQARVAKNAVQPLIARNPDAHEEAAKLFATEAKKLGLEVLTPQPISQRAMAEQVPDAQFVVGAAFGMREGEVSEFIETPRGGFFLLLKRRIKPTDAEFNKDREEFAAQQLERRQSIVFNEWASREFQKAQPPILQQAQQQQGVPQPQMQSLPPS